MSEREKARTRAQGAFQNFLADIKEEIKDRNDNYKEEFWEAILTEICSEFDIYC